jgi:hypothetical protein
MGSRRRRQDGPGIDPGIKKIKVACPLHVRAILIMSSLSLLTNRRDETRFRHIPGFANRNLANSRRGKFEK